MVCLNNEVNVKLYKLSSSQDLVIGLVFVYIHLNAALRPECIAKHRAPFRAEMAIVSKSIVILAFEIKQMICVNNKQIYIH